MLNHYQRFLPHFKGFELYKHVQDHSISFKTGGPSSLQKTSKNKNMSQHVERDIRDVSPPVSPLFPNRFATTGLFGEQGHQAAVHPVHLEASFASDGGMIHRMIWWLPHNDNIMINLYSDGRMMNMMRRRRIGRRRGENDHTSRIILNKCIFLNHNMLRWVAQHFMAHLRPYQPCNETCTTSANESRSILLHHPEV